MSRSDAANHSSFPHWVALASLGLVLWMFFGNTVPALHERDDLLSLQDELHGLVQRYETAIRDTQFGSGANKDIDLQGLLVAIDKRGFTPAELHALYPQTESAAAPEVGRNPKESGSRRTKFP